MAPLAQNPFLEVPIVVGTGPTYHTYYAFPKHPYPTISPYPGAPAPPIPSLLMFAESAGAPVKSWEAAGAGLSTRDLVDSHKSHSGSSRVTSLSMGRRRPAQSARALPRRAIGFPITRARQEVAIEGESRDGANSAALRSKQRRNLVRFGQ
jgi:hypothetical protein